MSIRGNHHHHQSRLADAAHVILNQIEEMFTSSEQDIVKNSRVVTKAFNKYIAKHPYMSAGSALLLGSVFALLLNKSNDSHQHTEHCAACAEKSAIELGGKPQKIDDILKTVTDEVKKHSLELCEAAVTDYVKKKPLQATGAALAAGVVLTLLSRR